MSDLDVLRDMVSRAAPAYVSDQKHYLRPDWQRIAVEGHFVFDSTGRLLSAAEVEDQELEGPNGDTVPVR